MAKLSREKVEEEVKSLEGWRYDNDFIVKDFKFKRFMQGIRFVNSVAEIAEKMQHHPDIHIRWTNVRLEIQTHDEGGVTEKDIQLARKIEAMLQKTKSK